METVNAPAVQITNESADGPVVFVCEHASNTIPPAFNHIGISGTAQQSHAGWDIGALALSLALSKKLASPLVASTVSRLVYDCNRAPDSDTAIVSRSETEDILGNEGLSPSQRAQRVEAVYHPFSQALADLILSIATKHTTLIVERNQPYGPTDDVTHTLQKP